MGTRNGAFGKSTVPGNVYWTKVTGRPAVLLTPDGPTDGGDYGPNTEGTETSGFLEAYNAAIAAGLELWIYPGHYVIAASFAYTLGTSYNYLFEFPTSTLAAPTNLKIVGKASGGATGIITSAPSGGLTSSPGQVVLDCSACTLPTQTAKRSAAFAPNSTSSSLGLTVTFENFSIIVPPGTSTADSSGVCAGSVGGVNYRDFTVSTPFSIQATASSNGVGLEFSAAGNDNTWSDNVNIGGFHLGANIAGAWCNIGSLAIFGCRIAMQIANSQADAGLMPFIGFLSIVQCYYSINPTGSTYPANFYIGSYNNYYVTGNASFPFGADWYDDNNMLAGIIGLSGVINGTSGAYVAATAKTAGTANRLVILSQTLPYGLSPTSVALSRAKDVRTGVASTDPSAITLVTVPAAGLAYRVTFSLKGYSGTVSSAIYTLTWTENGLTKTMTCTISALAGDACQVALPQPDNGTNITGQLTTLSGSSPEVNIACNVEQIA